MMEISTIAGLLLLLCAAFYLAIHLGLIAGIMRLARTTSKDRPLVSIIVAARNEEKNLGPLLECLVHQTYSKCEIIVVNDRSTDHTAELISGFQNRYSHIQRIDITDLSDDMPAKKNALRAGIEASRGEILCFTDADCLPLSPWIEQLVRSFTPGVGLVAGYSPYQEAPLSVSETGFLAAWLLKFIAYEEFRAASWAAGSIGWNAGWLCTGRNLAYRRNVYEEVHGFEQIKMSISGDDDLFLQVVRRQTAWKIQYVTHRESFVPTVPPVSFRQFVEQRKRHFSAAKFFTVPMMLFFFIYHSSNLLLLISPILLMLNVISLPILGAAIASKVVGDFLLFRYSSMVFDASRFRSSFFLMEIFYILYNSCIGPLGLFRKFAWKQS
ncbi:MAG: glycosyltransferase [Ignavibacteriae bacterium]|nr:MAG: glycosyltransferase [Ignavibacteriota bacterium]